MSCNFRHLNLPLALLPALILSSNLRAAEPETLFPMNFSNVTEPIYPDECCHLNQRGYDLLARFVAKEIAAAWGT